MNLLFIENIQSKKEKSNTLLIGKNGTIRFGKGLEKIFDFKNNDFWSLAIDKDEKILKTIFIVKTPNDKKSSGTKIKLQNGRWIIDAANFIKEFNLKVPIKCQVEEFKHGDLIGIKAIIL